MKVVLAVCCLAFAALAAPGVVPRDHPVRGDGCEPAEPVGIQARAVSVREEGGTAAVAVDITVSSRIDLAAVAVSARLGAADAGAVRDAAFPSGFLPRGYARTSRAVIPVPAGRDHELFLAVRAIALEGGPREAATWLPIALDPERRPRAAGNVLEYRAQPAGPGEP